MIGLVFSDLRDHATTWVGAFLVAVACGLIGGWAASFQATANFYAGDELLFKGLQQTVPVVVSFSSVAAVAVLASAANLTVSAQRQSYALWQLANVRPRLVSAAVLIQMAVVAVLGAACGTVLAAATFGPIFAVLTGSQEAFFGVAPQVDASLMPVVWLVVTGVFLLGGLRGARSAGKTPPLVALRDPEPKRAGMTWMRVILFAGLAACTCWFVSFMIESGPDEAMNWSLFMPLFVVATLAPLAPVLFSALLEVWTRLVPQKRWNAWYLARHTARHGLAASTSVETPIMVGFGLVAGIFSVLGLFTGYLQSQGIADINGLSLEAALLMLGGPVLLCAVGAAVSVVMTSRSRTRDVALLIVSGAQPKTLMAAAACEALIHAVTATLVGMACVVSSNALVAVAAGLPIFDGLVFGEGLAVSLVGFALVFAATFVPTCTALKRETATVLAMGQ